MNITVYCGSACGNDPAFADVAREVGHFIGSQGHTLVYGGGGTGLMGLVSDAVLASGGHVIGIIPGFLVEREMSRSEGIELHVVDTMDERKNMMIELGEAFVALPGGPGTLEEISEVFSMAKLDQLGAPCCLYNVKGYYDTLGRFLDQAQLCGFMTAHERAHLRVVDGLEQLDAALGLD